MSCPDDDLRVSRLRLWAVRAKDHSPRLIELRSPIRYRRNLRLVECLRGESYTMLGKRRARNLIELARRVDDRGIRGAIVDCGVWNGGSTILMGMGAPARQVWAFDSFEGMPRPGPRDPDAHPEWEGRVRGSEQMLREGFAEYARDPGRLRIVKGWFDEALAGASEEVGAIALLHIDADWYASVKTALEAFYGSVVDGGYVAIDDLTFWRGAKDATTEFRRDHGVKAPIHGNHYWRK